MATTNTFLQNYAPQSTAPTAPKPTPNYFGALGGLIGGLINRGTPISNNPSNPSFGSPNAFLNQRMGVQAKAPEQSVKPPTTTLSPTQVNTTTTKSPAQQSQTQNTNNLNSLIPTQAQVAPAAFGTSGNLHGQGVEPSPDAVAPPVQSGNYNANGQVVFNPYNAPTGTGLYGSLVAGLANRATASPEYIKAADDYQKAVQNVLDIKNKEAQTAQDIGRQPIEYTFQQGRQGLAQQFYAQKEAAAQSAAQQAQAAMGLATGQQQTQQGALQGAANLAGTVLSGGQYMPFGGDNASFQSGLDRQRAVDTYNYNTNQGLNYAAQASNLTTTLAQIDTLAPTLNNFLTQSGLNNQGSPFYNQAIKNYMAQVGDPAAVASLNNYMSELKKYTGQILLASGLTPTDVGNQLASFDPANLSPAQLSVFISNLRNAGQIQLQPLQQATTAAAPNSIISPYVGPTATPSTQSAYSTDKTPLINNPVGQGVVGLGIGAGTSFLNAITGIAGTIFGH